MEDASRDRSDALEIDSSRFSTLRSMEYRDTSEKHTTLRPFFLQRSHTHMACGPSDEILNIPFIHHFLNPSAGKSRFFLRKNTKFRIFTKFAMDF
jgi:hypothetical protein